MIYEDNHVEEYAKLEDIGTLFGQKPVTLMEVLTYGLLGYTNPLQPLVDEFVCAIKKYEEDISKACSKYVKEIMIVEKKKGKEIKINEEEKDI